MANRPLCARLREELLAQIERSEDGDRLPTEVVLAGRFGASRLTVHKVMNELQRDGLVRRRRGLGTFVSRGDRKVHTAGAPGINGSVVIAYTDWFSYDIWSKVESAERCALRHGLLPVNYKITRETMYQELPRLIDEYEDIRGIIVIPPGGAASSRQLAVMDGFGLPVVLLIAAPPFRARHLFTVSQDFGAIGRTAFDTLRAAGHERIAYIATEPRSYAWQLERQGMRDALRDAGLSRNRLIAHSTRNKTWEDAASESHALTADILRRQAPTGLVYDSFTTALAGAHAVREAGGTLASRVQIVVTAPWAGMVRYIWPRPLLVACDLDEIVARAFSIITDPRARAERVVRTRPTTLHDENGP